MYDSTTCLHCFDCVRHCKQENVLTGSKCECPTSSQFILIGNWCCHCEVQVNRLRCLSYYIGLREASI